MSSIATVLSPTSQIRQSCTRVMTQAKHVSINTQNIATLAEILISDGSVGSLEGISWDASGWHYNEDAVIFGPRTCQYIFVLDSLNFCFWETQGLEYDTLAVALKQALAKDDKCFDAIRLAQITEAEISGWFPVDKQMPNMIERVRVLQELGQILLDEFDGLAANLVSLAKGSAVKLVQLIIRYLPGFRDCSIYNGYRVELYKRAQILVGDLWAAYGRSKVDHNTVLSNQLLSPYAFYDIDQLTMFADYRVPQILRYHECLVYSLDLANRIDQYEEIPCGSEEEVEIRAATVMAVECLHQELQKKQMSVFVIEVDWLLWQLGEAIKDSIAPHHRTKTIFY